MRYVVEIRSCNLACRNISSLLQRFQMGHRNVLAYLLSRKGGNRFMITSLDEGIFVYKDRIIYKGKKIPMHAFRKLMRHWQSHQVECKQHLEFSGGLVFGFSYEFTDFYRRHVLGDIDETTKIAEVDATLPIGFVAFTTSYYIYKESTGRLLHVKLRGADSGSDALRDMEFESLVLGEPAPTSHFCKRRIVPFSSVFPDHLFHRSMAKIGAYFRRGETYETVLTYALKLPAETVISPRLFSDVVRAYYTSRYGYYCTLGDYTILGACNLPHLESRKGEMETLVLAGTRPRSSSGSVLKNTIRQLKSSDVDGAEHMMLVDVERNDLGRIARIGSVRVRDIASPMLIGSTIYLGTKVVAKGQENIDPFDLLMANFPRGVVSGAPKKSSMQIIRCLEEAPRNFYTGILGTYENRSRTLRSNVIVTCISCHRNRARIHIGGGITHETGQNKELNELRAKAKLLLRIIGLHCT